MPTASQRRELDLDFHSFCSVWTTAASNVTAAAINFFDEDGYSSYTHVANSSPDITYDKSTGKIKFAAKGTYFVISTIISESTSGNITVSGKITLNGTTAVQADGLVITAAEDPRPVTVHTVLNVDDGDIVEAVFTPSAANYRSAKGSYITVVRCNGHFANLNYTADADETTTASSYELFDTTNEGGTVVSNVNGIAYAAATGRLTTTVTRTFLIFSTWVYASDGTRSDGFHKININGSTLDELTSGATAGDTPECHSYHTVKAVTGGEYIAINHDQGGTTGFTAKKGTSLSVVDISNDGTNPPALLCFSVTNDTNAFADDSGDQNIFDSDNYGTFAKIDHVTATNITYTASAGTFAAVESGYHLVTSTIGFDSTSDGTPTFKLKKAGTDIYTSTLDLRADADPRSFPLCLIVYLDAGEELTFIINNAGADVDDGSSVSIIRLDSIANLHPQVAPTENLIVEDYTINSYSSDNLSVQHDRTSQTQVPFILGSRTTSRLRGRRPVGNTTTEGVGVDVGDKKIIT